jgi:hypothetical protein
MGEPWNIEKKNYWTTLKNMVIWGSKSWIPVVTMVLSIEASVEISLGAGRWTCISGPWSDEMSTTCAWKSGDSVTRSPVCTKF